MTSPMHEDASALDINADFTALMKLYSSILRMREDRLYLADRTPCFQASTGLVPS